MKPFYIVTTRFTNETWIEHQRWKEANNWTGCIYGVPSLISESSKIPINARVYVIEMNNDTNKIMGIGVICNCFRANIRCKIYNDKSYNNYIYKDKAYISRKAIKALDKRGFYKIFINYLEKMLFRGPSHMKRGYGFTSIAIKWKKKRGKLISLPLNPKLFTYFYKKFGQLSKQERHARLERIQHHILWGFNCLRFQ